MKSILHNIFNIRVRFWIVFLIIMIMIGPAFVIGWAAGIHDGFDTGAKVKALEIRNALIEGMRDKFDFFITDIKDVGFRPHGERKLNVCASFNYEKAKRVKIIKQ